MTALVSLGAVMMMQAETALTHDGPITVAICVIAAAILVQAIVMVVAGMGALKALKEVKGIVTELHATTMPLLTKSSALVEEISPKVRTLCSNAAEVSYTVREKVDEAAEVLSQVNRMVSATNARTEAQIAHVDRMVSTALNTVDEVSSTVANGVRKPVRQIAATISGLKVGFDTLLKNFGVAQKPQHPRTEFTDYTGPVED